MTEQHISKFELVPTKHDQYNLMITELIRDIEISEIPAKYIEQIEVGYLNGITITLRGSEITNSIPVVKQDHKFPVPKQFKDVISVKVFIDLDSIEQDINSRINKLFNGKISL